MESFSSRLGVFGGENLKNGGVILLEPLGWYRVKNRERASQTLQRPAVAVTT
jgi:hypothetical protein